MPRTEPLIKNRPNGVSNRRQKITIDGHTATRAYFQHLRRQSLKHKSKAKAEAKRLATDAATAWDATTQQHTESGEGAAASHAASSRVFYDYKRAELMELEDDEILAAWAAAASKVSGGRIKARKSDRLVAP